MPHRPHVLHAVLQGPCLDGNSKAACGTQMPLAEAQLTSSKARAKAYPYFSMPQVYLMEGHPSSTKLPAWQELKSRAGSSQYQEPASVWQMALRRSHDDWSSWFTQMHALCLAARAALFCFYASWLMRRVHKNAKHQAHARDHDLEPCDSSMQYTEGVFSHGHGEDEQQLTLQTNFTWDIWLE